MEKLKDKHAILNVLTKQVVFLYVANGASGRIERGFDNNDVLVGIAQEIYAIIRAKKIKTVWITKQTYRTGIAYGAIAAMGFHNIKLN